MTTFEILSVIFAITSFLGAAIAAYVSLKVSITEIKVEIKYIKENIEKLINEKCN